MSVYASGAIPPREIIDWVCQQLNIESIVFGASSRGNIHNTNLYWSSTKADAKSVYQLGRVACCLFLEITVLTVCTFHHPPA